MSNTKFKPTLCLDFDGVIHRYGNGWQDGEIYDDITTGFWEWAEEANKHFKLVVYSSRSKTEDARLKMMLYMQEQRKEWREAGGMHTTTDALSFDFVSEKPAAFVTIDDRALTFTGSWADFDPKKLREFKPWSLKKPALTALDEEEAAPSMPTWQPIETAPKDILIDIWLSEGVRWCGCHYDRITDQWRIKTPCAPMRSVPAHAVTHWMPLPSAPNGGRAVMSKIRSLINWHVLDALIAVIVLAVIASVSTGKIAAILGYLLGACHLLIMGKRYGSNERS